MQYDKKTELDYETLETMSLSERTRLIAKWETELADNIDKLRETGAAIAKLIEANKRH